MAESREDKFIRLAAPLEGAVYRTCLGYLKNAEDAKDAAQDSLLRAYRAMDSYRGEGDFGAWLHRVCARVCLDRLRKRGADLSLDALADSGYEPADAAPLPYERLEEQQRRALLRAALWRLPDGYRAALVMTALQGLRYEDAAALLEVPVGTVRSRVSRAKGLLKEILSEHRELFDPSARQESERRDDA